MNSKILDDIGLSMYSDIKGLSDSENGETINALLFDGTMRYYKDRLDINIIIPELPQKPTNGMIMGLFKSIKTKVWDSFKSHEVNQRSGLFKNDEKINILDDTDSAKYFGDFITTDVLDSVVTEIPIEFQLLKEEGCSELSGINSRIVKELEEFIKMDEDMGDLEEKRKIKRELETVIKNQEEIVLKMKKLTK